MQNWIHVPKKQIDETLTTPATKGKKQLEPFKSFATANGLPFNILEDSELFINDAEIHHHEADLWFCLEGDVKFICGGEMVNPYFKKMPDGTENKNEVKAAQITGGTEIIMRPGDWLWIPAGQPHQHFCNKTGRLVIIKVPKNKL